jgi:hypothetical protein
VEHERRCNVIVTDTPETDAMIRPYNNTIAGCPAVAASLAQRLERERDAALRRVKELEAMVTRLVAWFEGVGVCPPDAYCDPHGAAAPTCDDCIREWAKGDK